MKTGKGPIVLSDEARDRVSEQLHACYVATIVGRLREVGTLDLAAGGPRGRPGAEACRSAWSTGRSTISARTLR